MKLREDKNLAAHDEVVSPNSMHTACNSTP